MSKLNNLSCSYQISQVILLVGNDNSAIDEFKSTLKSAFKIWDFGPANYFFWVWDYTQQHCYWEKYTLELLEDDGLLGCKPLSVPMELNFKMSSADWDPLEDSSVFTGIVRRLLYLTHYPTWYHLWCA